MSDRQLLDVASRIERHEAVCSERYKGIDEKLHALDEKFDVKVDALHEHVNILVNGLQGDMTELKMWFKWGLTTFVTGICGILGTLLFK